MEPLRKVPTIPHKKFLVGRDRLNSVEVDVHPVLTGSQVLLPGRVSWIHVAHPVAFLLIKAINEVVELLSGVDLFKGEDRCSVKDRRLAQSDSEHRRATNAVPPGLPGLIADLVELTLNEQKWGSKEGTLC